MVCILVGECYEVTMCHIENLVQILDYRDVRISILMEERKVFSNGTNIPSTVKYLSHNTLPIFIPVSHDTFLIHSTSTVLHQKKIGNMLLLLL